VEHLCAVLELVMQLQSKRYATHGGTCNIHGRTDGKFLHGNVPNQSKSGAMSWRPRDVGCCYEPSMAEQLGRLQHSAISCWTATIKPSSQNSGFSYTTRRLSSHTAWSNRHKALSSVQCRNYWILQLLTLLSHCKMHLLYSLLTILSVSCSIVLGECFYPDGTAAPGLVPCNEGAEVSHCCRDADMCLTNGLCFSSGLGSTLRRGCTDKNWNKTACPDICTGEWLHIQSYSRTHH
jgi:hypothetical protein